jgi:altronate hydrolase
MVHSHNTEFREFVRDYAHASEFKADSIAETERATFSGLCAGQRRVGTRN